MSMGTPWSSAAAPGAKGRTENYQPSVDLIWAAAKLWGLWSAMVVVEHGL